MSKTYEEQRAELAAELAEWKGIEFGLRAHVGTFRVSERDSYHDGQRVQLYTEKRNENRVPLVPGAAYDPFKADQAREWQPFAKGTREELRGQMVPWPTAPAPKGWDAV